MADRVVFGDFRDNLCVINALKGAWKCPWGEDMLIADSRLDLRSFRTVCIRHVFREVNCVADRLAFLGHTTTTNNLDSDLELRVLIRKDALGWTTDRLVQPRASLRMRTRSSKSESGLLVVVV